MTHDYTVELVYVCEVSDVQDKDHAREVAIEHVRGTYASPDYVEFTEWPVKRPGREGSDAA